MSEALRCCLCLHAREGVAPEADTVINGQAVCYDHMGYVQGGLFSQALATVREHEGRTEALAPDEDRLDEQEEIT